MIKYKEHKSLNRSVVGVDGWVKKNSALSPRRPLFLSRVNGN